VHGSAGKRPGVGEMIFAGVEAERNTNDAIWIRIRPSAPVSLAASVPPDPEAAEAAGSGGTEQKSKPDEFTRLAPSCIFNSNYFPCSYSMRKDRRPKDGALI